MNKKLEEKLAMLAFGDMDPEETLRLESELGGNSEAQAVLAQYRGMRSGLKALGDIPEHQLSTERLRHAVLNRGLKPRTRPQLGWLWMPAMAFALAFGIFLVRSITRQVPIVMPGGGLGSSFGSNLGDVQPENAFAYATASAQVLSVVRQRPRLVPAANRHYGRHSRQNGEMIESLKAQVTEEFANEMLTTNPGTLARSQPPPNDSREAAGPIVLIGTTKDAHTGAQKATEVDSADNVVVGG